MATCCWNSARSGIWGGLWNPPERPSDYANTDFFAAYDLRPAPDAIIEGTPFRHSFSHYHLDITPVFVTLPGALPTLTTDGDPDLWYQPDSNQQQLGLSAVAVKLLPAPLPEPQLDLG